VVFGLFILLAMLMAAGLAVDTMRHERERVRMQATLDRAVLAAADLEQRRDPRQVVRDYFAAAGIPGALGEVSVESGLNARTVTAGASLDLDTIFLDLVGVDTLRAAVGATAEESVTDVEISLVLDVSNSMEALGTSRMENLRVAATEFVETVMPRAAEPTDSAITTLNLVPYATSVNIGPEIMSLYNVDDVHSFSNCVLFDDDDYDDLALLPSWPLTQYEHFDITSDGGYRGNLPEIARPLCPRPEVNPMIPLGADPQVLTQAVGNLVVAGSTEMDAGMRWGIAMLDPESRPVVDRLIEMDLVGEAAAGRPLDYGAERSLKVAVLMTDGEPQAPYDLNPKLKEGASNVWYDQATGRYSVLLRGHYLRDYPYERAAAPRADGTCRNVWLEDEDDDEERVRDGIRRVAASPQDDENCEPLWYWPHKGEFSDHPYWSRADPSDVSAARLDWMNEPGVIRLLNRDVHNRFVLPDAQASLYYKPALSGYLSSAEWNVLSRYRDRYGRWQGTAWRRLGTTEDTMDRLLALCDAAREPVPGIDRPRIFIFTIGFEIDAITSATGRERARRLMRDCATAPEFYFDVDGLEIAEAFHLIASQINKLRLTR
jgi:Flp pilus assembly protein TadG